MGSQPSSLLNKQVSDRVWERTAIFLDVVVPRARFCRLCCLSTYGRRQDHKHALATGESRTGHAHALVRCPCLGTGICSSCWQGPKAIMQNFWRACPRLSRHTAIYKVNSACRRPKATVPVDGSTFETRPQRTTGILTSCKILADVLVIGDGQTWDQAHSFSSFQNRL